MQHQVLWLDDVTFLVLENGELHVKLKSVLLMVLVISIFVDFHNRTRYDKSSVISLSLDRLSVFKLRIIEDLRIIAVKNALLVQLEVFKFKVLHFVNLRHVNICLSVAEHLGLHVLIVVGFTCSLDVLLHVGLKDYFG